VLDAQWLRLGFKGRADGATLRVAGATYGLSRRTAAYATVGQINNRSALPLSVSAGAGGSNPLAGSSQTGLATGFARRSEDLRAGGSAVDIAWF